MATGAELASFTDRKLVSFKDFDTRLLRYLQKLSQETTKRLFVQGSFTEAMPLSSPGSNRVRVDLKPTLLDGIAHDGAGHILDLAQVDRVAYFANVNATVYEVGAGYVEYPKEIRINPNNGRPEYDRYVEGIGVEATPTTVESSSTTITFRLDNLFETGTTQANHAGRLVRVFRKTSPATLALTESVAIETCTVFNDGQNRITTTGLLGQAVVSTTPSDYVVQLIGLSVLKNNATNRPSLLPASYFYIGTVTGNGGTPSSFNITAQRLVQAQAASATTVLALANWADGTTNPATDLQTALAKLVTDLTSASGLRGAGKITAAALANWADGTTNPAATLAAALAKFVTDLTSTTGLRGAGKITAAALANWADGTTNPAATLGDALAKLVTDLTSTTGARGAGKLTAAGLTGLPYSVAAQSLNLTLQSTIDALNAEVIMTERRAEHVAVQTLRLVYQHPGWTLRELCAVVSVAGVLIDLIAVGDNGGIVTRRSADSFGWVVRTAGSSSTTTMNAITGGSVSSFAIAGANELHTSGDNGVSWTRRLASLGQELNDIAYKSGAGAAYCAVGTNGTIYRATSLATWTAQTAAVGLTTHNLVAIAFGAGLFVVTTASGQVMTSPDGITWTARPSGTLSVGGYSARQLHYSAYHGFVATWTVGGSQIGVSYSIDGITWTHSAANAETGLDESIVRFALLDRQIVYVSTASPSSPYSVHAIVARDATVTPTYTGSASVRNIPNICECFPHGAVNAEGTLYVLGRLNGGDGCIYAGAPFRPNSQFNAVS